MDIYNSMLYLTLTFELCTTPRSVEVTNGGRFKCTSVTSYP